MKKTFLVILCLCICLSLSACQKRKSGSSVDDSFLEGVDKGREYFFMELWEAAYNPNTKDSGELWETDQFSLRITATEKMDMLFDEIMPYIEVDFALNVGTIDSFWEQKEILFSIYSYNFDGYTKVWDSDEYYWYFLSTHENDTMVGNKGSAEIRIPEDAIRLAVILVINGNLYAASYGVDI